MKNSYVLYPMLNVQSGEYKSVLYSGYVPGKYEKNSPFRTLKDDLKNISNEGVKVIICLMEWSELISMNIMDYPRIAQQYGFIFYHLPISDGKSPKISEVNTISEIIRNHLSKGESVLIHCKEGKNRTGLVCACCLIHLGYKKKVIRKVQDCRPGALQNLKHQQYIIDYLHK